MSENERPADMPKLTDYRPTRYMLPTSHYDAAKADRAVKFIEMLRHTKGKWAGKRFWLLPWQEQIIRDLFGIVKENGKSCMQTTSRLPRSMALRQIGSRPVSFLMLLTRWFP